MSIEEVAVTLVRFATRASSEGRRVLTSTSILPNTCMTLATKSPYRLLERAISAPTLAFGFESLNFVDCLLEFRPCSRAKR